MSKRPHARDAPRRTRARLLAPEALAQVQPPLPAAVVETLGTLPPEMQREIVSALVITGVTTGDHAHPWQEIRALTTLSNTNRALREAVRVVVQRTWREQHELLKQQMGAHDWRQSLNQREPGQVSGPGRDLAALIRFNGLRRMYEHMGIRETTQLGLLVSNTLVPLPDDEAERILAVFSSEYRRRENAWDHWFNLLQPAQRTFAQMLECIVDRYSDYPTWGQVLPLLVPAWCARNADECITWLWLYVEKHGASWEEELSYIRPALVAAVLQYKLGVPADSPVLVRIRQRGNRVGFYDNDAVRYLADYWHLGMRGDRRLLEPDVYNPGATPLLALLAEIVPGLLEPVREETGPM